MKDFIYQGGSPISEADFRTYLGSLWQLENIGVLLGAGASAGCGGKTMKDVWLEALGSQTNLASELMSFKLVTLENVAADNVNVELLLDNVSQFLSVYKK